LMFMQRIANVIPRWPLRVVELVFTIFFQIVLSTKIHVVLFLSGIWTVALCCFREPLVMVLSMRMILTQGLRMFCNNRKRQPILKGLVNLSVLTTWSMATVNFRRAAYSIIRQAVFKKKKNRYTVMWFVFPWYQMFA
jgi:hypothetical protein